MVRLVVGLNSVHPEVRSLLCRGKRLVEPSGSRTPSSGSAIDRAFVLGSEMEPFRAAIQSAQAKRVWDSSGRQPWHFPILCQELALKCSRPRAAASTRLENSPDLDDGAFIKTPLTELCEH